MMEWGGCKMCDGLGNCHWNHSLEWPEEEWDQPPIEIKCKGECHFCSGSGLMLQKDIEALDTFHHRKRKGASGGGIDTSDWEKLQEISDRIKEAYGDEKLLEPGRSGSARTAMPKDDALLDSLEFRHKGGPLWNRINALDSSSNLHGYIEWSTPHKTVGTIYVEPQHRHKGVATALWNKAKEVEPDIKHSWEQTPKGRDWTRSLGPEDAAHADRIDELSKSASVEDYGHWYSKAFPSEVREKIEGLDVDQVGDCVRDSATYTARLKEQGVEAELVHGYHGDWSHAWVGVGRHIFDPTAGQFDCNPEQHRRHLNQYPASDRKWASQTRMCMKCKEVFSISQDGEATGFCQNCREEEGMVTHHSWSEDAQEGHYGSNTVQGSVPPEEGHYGSHEYPDYLYHSAHPRHRKSIEEGGLRAAQYEDQPHGVYLFSDWDDACSWQEGHDVYQVFDVGDVRPDPHPDAHRGMWYVDHDIKPHQLLRLDKQTGMAVESARRHPVEEWYHKQHIGHVVDSASKQSNYKSCPGCGGSGERYPSVACAHCQGSGLARELLGDEYVLWQHPEKGLPKVDMPEFNCPSCGNGDNRLKWMGGGEAVLSCNNCGSNYKHNLMKKGWPRTTSRKPRVFMGIGIPGSGKSTYLKPYAESTGVTYISSDGTRAEVTGDAADVTQDAKVWPVIYRRLHEALDRGEDVVFDSTASNGEKRRHVVNHLREKAGQVHAIYFDVPLEVAQARNLDRTRVVPPGVVDAMHAQLQEDPPREEEGLDSITRLGGNTKESSTLPRNDMPCEACGSRPAEWNFWAGVPKDDPNYYSYDAAHPPLGKEWEVCDRCKGDGCGNCKESGITTTEGWDFETSPMGYFCEEHHPFSQHPAYAWNQKSSSCQPCGGSGLRRTATREDPEVDDYFEAVQDWHFMPPAIRGDRPFPPPGSACMACAGKGQIS